MARRRTAPRSSRSAPLRAENVAAFLLGAGLLAAGLVVDTRAESAFDAPKRLAAIVSTALAAALVLSMGDMDRVRSVWQRAPSAIRTSIAAYGAALAAVVVSAMLSPRSSAALASSRGMLILALLAPLATLSFDARGMRRIFGCFVALSAINALVSLVQRGSGWQPLALERIGGRTEAVAMFGNEGYLALVAALGAIAAAALWFDAQRGMRTLLTAALVTNVAGVAANASLTPILTLVAGAFALALPRLPRRVLLGGAIAAVLLVAIAFATIPQLRARATESQFFAGSGQLDAVTSYRLGAWAAACEMIVSRPITGFGPGSFASEFVVHRIAAEQRWGRRLANPHLVGGSYEEAHCDYLQAVAETGLVATLLFAFSAALVVGSLKRSAPGRERSWRAEAWILAALAVTLAVGALTWFPMQRPVTAMLTLVLLGRAWSLGCELDEVCR